MPLSAGRGYAVQYASRTGPLRHLFFRCPSGLGCGSLYRCARRVLAWRPLTALCLVAAGRIQANPRNVCIRHAGVLQPCPPPTTTTTYGYGYCFNTAIRRQRLFFRLVRDECKMRHEMCGTPFRPHGVGCVARAWAAAASQPHGS